ncbi:FAD:protein FMN transferase [Pseudomonas nitroreducens]|uniref:FAD:protein FMN transferase n=1 Tax=Pseudomonas TaxID=286 RepID=UPI0007EE5820|nr:MULTISPECIES: FAD:protein FMN transferase [Pseudomonas]MDG9857237.1 FAD:protein FMN transferase [Pseudomonas nitroreducens]MDH1075125.1 FAD:protein FMN transferase [Pseudomonas nitroreducens]NMZ75756.1 FAD:protein FMN transferase [Pseudomonas nitroreducens]OBY48986.1 thiamine biosynthesis protein ApbE [Pseudomonas sp. AU12215]
MEKTLSRASLLIVLLVATLTGCGQSIERFGGPTMGSSYTVQYVPTGKAPDAAKLKAEVDTILASLDEQFSTYRDNSVVSRFNALPAGACMALSADMLKLWRYGEELSQQSGGAFDLSVEPLMNLWGFGPQSRREQVPAPADLQRERTRVGHQHLRLQGEQLCKDVDAQLDFDSIVAGYAVDQVSARLMELGLTDYLVEITGELKAVGHKPDGSPWRIALEVPSGERERQVERSVALDGIGLSTSGDYRNYFEEGGQRYSHTFDPRTGAPVRHALASVTVAEAQALRADGLSTLLMVLGPEEGYTFAERNGLAAFFIVRQGEGFVTRATPRFEALFPSPE